MGATYDFTGRVALITGAGSGMGEEYAKKLASSGCDIVMVDIEPKNLLRVQDGIKRFERKMISFHIDVSNYKDVYEAVKKALDTFNKIDILINNAGITGTVPVLTENIEDEEWDRLINTNLKGAFNFSKALIKPMKERKYGKIVNVSSSAGRSVSENCGSHYAASKAGILGLTRQTAFELAPYNINVNAICPGIIDTPMLRAVAGPERIELLKKDIPLGKIGTTTDAANLVAFLVSEESSFITGASFDLNGGSLII
jgi:3-oxoacyl-[acyl-carrier protein] reductase